MLAGSLTVCPLLCERLNHFFEKETKERSLSLLHRSRIIARRNPSFLRSYCGITTLYIRSVSMPRLATTRSSRAKRLVLAATASCLLLLVPSHAQGNDGKGVLRHQVNVWYTWIAPGDSIATLAKASSIQEINTIDGEYEYSDVPTTENPSGMKLHLDVNLTHIRIEMSQPPMSDTTYTDRLYVAFYWPLLLVDLSTPVVLPEELVSFQAWQANTSIPLVDPEYLWELEATLPEGALLVEFVNISAAAVPILPLVMEFSYFLEIAPSGAPTVWPTLGPTFTPHPTLFSTTSAMPSPGPPSPVDTTPTSSPTASPNSRAAEPLQSLFQTVALASLVAAWLLA